MWLVTNWETGGKFLMRDTNVLQEFLKTHQTVTVEWVNEWIPSLPDPEDNSPRKKAYVPLIPLSRAEEKE